MWQSVTKSSRAYWDLADPAQDMTVHMLQAYHTAGNTATLGWNSVGSTSTHSIMTQTGAYADTVYPNQASGPAIANVLPTSLTAPFGLEVDGWYSDNNLNLPLNAFAENQSASDVGHFVRIYPAINENGVYIPNTYILIMDYEGENLDYNDTAYLISNIRPATGLAAPLDVAGYGDTVAGNTLTWNAVSTMTGTGQASLTGYNVYRSISQNSGFTAQNTTPITATTYVDTTAVVGTQYYYRVTAVGTGAISESYGTEITLTRPNSSVAPAAPIVSAAPTAADTITVSWGLSSGATTYTILRSTTGLAGSYSQLTPNVGGSVTQYADTNLTTNSTYYYEVIANRRPRQLRTEHTGERHGARRADRPHGSGAHR